MSAVRLVVTAAITAEAAIAGGMAAMAQTGSLDDPALVAILVAVIVAVIVGPVGLIVHQLFKRLDEQRRAIDLMRTRVDAIRETQIRHEEWWHAVIPPGTRRPTTGTRDARLDPLPQTGSDT